MSIDNGRQSGAGIPFSPQQRVAWLRETQAGVGTHVTLVARAARRLGAAAVADALRGAASAYEVLRSRSERLPGLRTPIQVVDRGAAAIVETIAPREGENEAEAIARAQAEAQRVATGTVATSAFVVVEHEGVSLVAARASALWADGATLRIVIGEAGRILAGRPPAEEAPLQYGEYARWLEGLASQEEARTGVGAWRDALRRPHVALDGARVRSGGGPTGDRVELSIDAETAASARELARATGVTLEAPLLVAWCMALGDGARGARAILVTLAGRDFPELRDIAGPLAQRVPLPIRVDADRSFADIVVEVEQQLATAREWLECYPIAAGRDPTPPGVAFELHGPPEGVGECFTILDEDADDAGEYLALRCRERGPELRCVLAFDAGCISREHVSFLAERFAQHLRSGVARASEPVGRARLLGACERAAVIGPIAGLPVARNGGASVLDALHARVEESPQAIAVRCGSEALTYEELAGRALRAASALRERGAERGELVVVVFRRSVDLAVGIFGALLAGCAYAPIDPSYPRERVEQIVAGAKARFALVHGPTADAVRPLVPEVLYVDDPALLARASSSSWPSVAESDPAYAIFTSGSTGRPKGVLVTHGNLATSTLARSDFFGAGASACLLLYSYAFDSSVAPIYGTLCQGGTLVIAADGAQQDPAAIGELIREHAISHVYCNPNVWRLVVQEVPREALRSVRVAIVAGEACVPALVERHFAVLPEARIVNEYGPTEATVWCTGHAATRDDAAAPRVPIGRPISNSSIYLLGADLEPVPVGAEGEVFVGGAGVSLGYLGDARATADRFVPDPFAEVRGARMYRTGDRARHLSDGRLEFLGRLDQQVKIRGFRVELQEIESVLSRLDEVDESVVVARRDDYGERLVAYVVPRDGTLDVAALRTAAGERLPEYMVPAAVVVLESLPRNAHGKVDRAALPAPDSDRPGFLGEIAHPETDAERALAAIWCEVLKVDRVGIDDDFFGLGGDSIRVIQVRAKAAARGLLFTVPEFISNRTIRGLAARAVIAPKPTDAKPALAPFELVSCDARARLPSDVTDAFPMTRLQAGMLFHSALADRQGVYHDAASYHLRGPCDLGALERAIGVLVERHEALRLSFDLTAPGEPLQRVHQAGTAPLSIEDLRGTAPEAQRRTVDAWLDRERLRPFDWAKPGLVRFAVHRTSDDTFHFSWIVHHAVLDGWSGAVLLAELFEAYRAILRGGASAGTTPPARLRDYVALERASLGADDARAFWRTWLDGAEATLLDPRRSDRRDRVQRAASRAVSVTVPTDVVEGVTRLARDEGQSLRTILLAAHVAVIARFADTDDVVTGVVSNGRPETAGGERVVGLFLNVLPLRHRLAGGTWRSLARDVARAEERMLPHRRFPLAEIHRVAGGRALFDATFNFNHFHALDADAREGFTVLDTRAEEETNFTLAATFARDPRDPSALHLRVAADAAVLSEEQLASILELYVRALTVAAQDPDAPIPTALESPRDRAASVHRSDPISSSDALEGGVIAAFARAARDAGDAEAVWSPEGSWTYRELAERSWAYARAVARVARPGSIVGVCFERSREWVAATLGVLGAGCAYLPLDPHGPEARAAAQLADVRAAVVVTTRALRDRVTGLPTLVEPPPAETAPAFEAVDASALAYAIFTSGSTGRPKGVAVSHGALAAHLRWRHAAFPLARGARFLQKAASSFDIAVWELLAPLTAGAVSVLARHDGQRDPEYVAALIADERVTDVHFNPATLAQFLDADASSRCDALRRVFVGGDTLPGALARRLRERTRAAVVHQYGPTEATIDATAFALAERVDDVVPIGAPIAGTSAYVLDARLRCAPFGAPGELFLGGASVAVGYLGDARRTAERFLPDPFGTPGTRMYRTGDRVRALGDGSLVFLGRRDHQVKIRGHRVELGEVEAALRDDPLVRDGVVATRGEGEAKQLVAYVVRRDATELDTPALRARLRARLPEPMIPAGVVVLEALPTTATGKVDRRALPEWNPETTQEEHVAPRNDRERRIVSAVARILGIAAPSVNRSFFDLGGDSLRAVQLRAVVRAEHAVDLPLFEIFRSPSLAALAECLERSSRSSLVTLRTGASRAPVILVHPIDGESWWFVELARRLRPGRAVYGLESPLLREQEPRTVTVGSLVAAYADEILATVPGPYVLGGYSFGGVVACELAERLARTGGKVERVLLLDAWVTPPAFASGAPTTPVWAAHRAAWAKHRATRLSAPATLIQLASRSDHERARQRDDWARALDASPEAVVASGDHDTMLKPPHVDRLAALMDEALHNV